MNLTFEISEYNNLLIYKKGYSINFIRKVITDNNLNGLKIFDHLDPLETLDFLGECSFLKELRIDCINSHDYSFLNNLIDIEKLSLGQCIFGKNNINLSKNINLKELTLNFKNNNFIGFENCINIEELNLIYFNEKDFVKFSSLVNIRKLNSKISKIYSLNGLNFLNKLQNIVIGNSINLNSINSINGLKSIVTLSFNGCININDFKSLDNLPNLEYLDLIDCGTIDSIKFISNFHSLIEINLLGNTIVKDGDMTPLKAIKNASFEFKEHYNSKSNLKYNNLINNNINKINRL